MNNLAKRTISGIALIVLVGGAILLSEYSMLGLVFLIYAGSITEYKRMMKVDNTFLYVLTLGSGILFILLNYFFVTDRVSQDDYLLFMIAALTAFLLYYLLFNRTSLQNISSMLLGSSWIAMSLSFYMALGWMNAAPNYNPEVLLVIIALIWVNDIAAYVIGSLIGRRALAPKISPGKTVEGFTGGILLNALAGYVVFLITGSQSIVFWIVVAALISMTATAGDLFESKMKREAGVKDSGKLIPGHGGMLDRFDSLFFSAPMVYLVYLIIDRL